MADYIEILDTQIEPDAPLTAALAAQFRDNPEAIAEGASGAPRIDPINAMAHQGQHFAVGTYGFFTGTNANPGSTTAGSNLTATGAVRQIDDSASTGFAELGGTPGGTWRCMGNAGGSGVGLSFATLWLRIA